MNDVCFTFKIRGDLKPGNVLLDDRPVVDATPGLEGGLKMDRWKRSS